MSANTSPVQVTEKKARKPTLSAKYSKFMVFGYNLMQSLRASDIINDEGLESAYAQLKLFDSVDNQTEFYEQVLNQTKETGKTMRKFITQRNKPPKAARKPRAKKEAAAPASEAVTSETAAPTEKKEKKPRKPRAKKTTEVVQDTQNDVVSDIVAAANADPLEGIPVVTEEKPKKTRKPRAKKETTTEVVAPKSPEKKDAVEVKTPDAPKKTKKTKTVVENTTPTVVQEELEEEEITTQEIVIKGVTYLMDDDNNLYSVQTHEDVGSYNPETEEITLNT